MALYELAQVNFARLKAPMEAPQTRGFVENLDRINALADSQPGFVWAVMKRWCCSSGVSARPTGALRLRIVEYSSASRYQSLARFRTWRRTESSPLTVLAARPEVKGVLINPG